MIGIWKASLGTLEEKVWFNKPNHIVGENIHRPFNKSYENLPLKHDEVNIDHVD